MKTSTVTILMATYNGEKYVKEQIESIQNQTFKNWEMLIRDDDSTDSTLLIIKEFASKNNRINIVEDSLGNIGCAQNFSLLLESLSDTEYVMFADQDDVWLPSKIEETFKLMIQKESYHGKKTPLLIYTGKQFVDESLNYINIRQQKHPAHNILNKIIAQNFIFGCTVMINTELYKHVYPISEHAENHDYWITLIAAHMGFIHLLPKRTILYRQHSNNISGSIKDKSFNRRFIRVVKWKGYQELIKNRRTMLIHLSFFLRKKKIKESTIINNYLKSFKKNNFYIILYILKNGIFKYNYGVFSNFIYILSILFNKYEKDNIR